MIPRRIAQIGRRWLPHGLWEGPSDRRWLALSFDDGPHPVWTPRILDALRFLAAPASFFVEGRHAQRRPELVQRMHADGHEVGNHTWSHRLLSLGGCLSPVEQLKRTETLLTRLCPGSPRLFRPPYGMIGPGGGAALAQTGLVPIYWSVVPGDWDPLPPDELTRRVLADAHPGAVVVLHGGRNRHSGAAYGLERLVTSLRDRGYELVSLARMLAARGMSAGVR